MNRCRLAMLEVGLWEASPTPIPRRFAIRCGHSARNRGHRPLPQNSYGRTRRGISLIEMLIVITGCAGILSLSAVLLHRGMRAQEDTRYFFAVERAAWRLAEQFREDAHRADAVVLEDSRLDDGAFIVMQFADGESVEYRRQGAQIVRILSHDGDATATEQYSLASVSELVLREEQSPRRLILTVESSPEAWLPAANKPRPGVREQPINLRVEAVIGRDARHAPARAAAEDAS
jgi:hypothetical protein